MHLLLDADFIIINLLLDAELADLCLSILKYSKSEKNLTFVSTIQTFHTTQLKEKEQ